MKDFDALQIRMVRTACLSCGQPVVCNYHFDADYFEDEYFVATADFPDHFLPDGERCDESGSRLKMGRWTFDEFWP